MKKLSFVFIAGLLVSGLANAAPTTIATTAITPAECAALQAGASVKITLSSSNIGAYDCTATGAAIGVAVGNTAGKGITYSTGSGGGAITATTETVSDANLKTRATAKMNAANSS